MKEYEVAQVINFLFNIHIPGEVELATGTYENLDAIGLLENRFEIIISWLKDRYDEEKGFELYTGCEKRKECI